MADAKTPPGGTIPEEDEADEVAAGNDTPAITFGTTSRWRSRRRVIPRRLRRPL